MEIELQTAPQIVADGVKANARGGRTGELAMMQVHGRYFEAAWRGKLFTAYAGAVVVSVAGTAMTGLTLHNPTGSGVNAILQKTSGIIAVTSATALGIQLGVNLQTATPTGLTVATNVVNNNLGLTANPLCKAYNAATVAVAPAAFKTLLHNTAAIAATGVDQGWNQDLEGSLVLPPGFAVSLLAITAATAAASVYADLSWEEVPA